MNVRRRENFFFTIFSTIFCVSIEQCIKEHERSFSSRALEFFFCFHAFLTLFTHSDSGWGRKMLCQQQFMTFKKISTIKKYFLRKLFMARHYNRVSSAIIAKRKKKNCLSFSPNSKISISSLLNVYSHKFSTALYMHSLIWPFMRK